MLGSGKGGERSTPLTPRNSTNQSRKLNRILSFLPFGGCKEKATNALSPHDDKANLDDRIRTWIEQSRPQATLTTDLSGLSVRDLESLKTKITISPKWNQEEGQFRDDKPFIAEHFFENCSRPIAEPTHNSDIPETGHIPILVHSSLVSSRTSNSGGQRRTGGPALLGQGCGPTIPPPMWTPPGWAGRCPSI